MAELTEEQKIIIGVCVGVAGVILIAIIVFICCTFYTRDRKRRRGHVPDKEKPRRYYHKERLPDYEYEKRPYTIYNERPPPYENRIYDYPPPPVIEPLPPPEPIRREVVVTRPRYYDYDRYSEPVIERRIRHQTNPNNNNRRYDDGPIYKTEPIVIPLSEPEYSYPAPRRELGETIYLKERRYHDDQALLPKTNVVRRTVVQPLRRSRSYHDIRRSQPYVGEWYKRPDDMAEFNEGALRAGRDPFLWKNGRY